MQRPPHSPNRSRATKKLHHAVNFEHLEPRRLLSATAPVDGALIDTSVGGMFVQLRSDLAPNTVSNFLTYVNSGAYNNTIIHRITTVKTDGLAVIQGGGFKVGTDSTGAQSLRPLGNFLGSTNDTLTFTAGVSADTITRSEGSFIADAFAPGQVLTITNATSNNKTVHIASVTPTVITLSDAPGTLTTQSITDSTDVGITVTGGTFTGDASTSVTFAPATHFLGDPSDTLTFAANGTGADTITRATGSFITDGFASGQAITISGTTLNNTTVHIDSISGDGLTITLAETTGALADETITDSTNVIIASGGVITRSAGSFISDGFAAGQIITIAGTGTVQNDRTFQVTSVTGTVLTLSVTTGALTNQTLADSSAVRITAPGLPTIADENVNTPNILGTIAMAKTSSPDSANTEWFINTADNSNALAPQNQSNGGFTVFGQVIYGLNTALAINNLRSFDASSTLGGAATELPITNRNQFVNVISVTQEQFMTITIGTGQAENSVLFTDADGTHTTLIVNHGTATITLTGTSLSSSSAGGLITLGGTVNELEDIVTSNTSLATTLTAASSGGDLHTTAHNLTTSGPLGSVQLNAIDLVGTYTTVGPVSWTGPSNTQNHPEDVVPATLTVSGAKTLAYQFDIAANITQTAGHSFLKGSNTAGTNPLSTETLFNIDATGTTTASILKVTAAKNKFVSIGGFTTTGSMNGVDSRHTMNLTGPMVVAGTMRRVNLIGMSGANIAVQGTTKGKTLIIDSPDNFDSSVFSSIPIKSVLVAGSWISSTPYPVNSLGDPSGNSSSIISAPSIGNIIALGTFGADLNLTDAKTPLQSVRIGHLAKCNWTIASSVGTMLTGAIDSAFRTTISGNLTSLRAGVISSGDTTGTHTIITVDGNAKDIFITQSQTGFTGTVNGNIDSLKTFTYAGSWTANTIKAAKFDTVTAGFLVASAPLDAKKLAIGSVLVLGTADNFFIQTINGNIGSITADAFTDRSKIMVGILDVGSNTNSLVDSPSKYKTHASIGSVTTHRTSSPSYINTLIDAWTIGKLNLGTIVLENVGVPFGLAANSIDFISARGNNGQNLSFTHKLDDPAALQQEILQRGLSTVDFHIVLV